MTIDDAARGLAASHDVLGRTTARPSFAWSIFRQALCEWPTDAFAFAATLLQTSGAYTCAASPHVSWPPKGWATNSRKIGRAWRDASWPGPGTSATRPSEVDDWLDIIESHKTLGVLELSEPHAWSVCEAVLSLLTCADEACPDFGLSGYVPGTQHVNTMLIKRGTLTRFAPEMVRVLPNIRTPQSGITLRSLSFHLSAVWSEIDVLWRTVLLDSGKHDSLNILLLPLPFEIATRDFRPTAGTPVANVDSRLFGFFEFAPADLNGVEDFVIESIAEARKEHNAVHMVVLPELALSKESYDRLKKKLRRATEREGSGYAPMLLTGVREDRRNSAYLLDPNFGHEFVQDKHHRWFLDDSQIAQYGLGSVLPRNRKWWEDMEIPRRKLHFVVANEWLTLCPLICEDLARQDPVASVVRAVGPSLIVALLLDGPQLSSRWSARYATVLAEDPGSSVLTLSSGGMTAMSRPPPGKAVSRSIGLWKDPRGGLKELVLDAGKGGLLLNVFLSWQTEWTADGRDDGGRAAHLVLGGTWGIAPPTGWSGRARGKLAEMP